MSTTACDWVSSNERCLARTMANQEATPGSQSEESNALDLPSAYDIRDYVLQRPSQEANSEAFSSEEAFSIPCSSDTDPGTSMVAQWLRICLPMQGTQVRSLVQEDPTCHGAAKPVNHNY
ncbi:shieldin complex subunit 1 isoform X8 [Pseudorca crassidens]|uniref:shieldin complex subunit 1 isoform X8 n=1 Tax=Pseudorca crassidens TaxID=82174 RepID=UPI00352ECEF3